MDISKIIAAGKAVAALDPRAAGVIAAIDAVVAVVNDIREVADLSAEDVTKLEEARVELEARVNAHADATAAKLAD